MTFLEKLAIYVTTACLIIIYFLLGLLPGFLYWVTWNALWFLLYLIIIPAMLIAAATVQRLAIEKNKKAEGRR